MASSGHRAIRMIHVGVFRSTAPRERGDLSTASLRAPCDATVCALLLNTTACMRDVYAMTDRLADVQTREKSELRDK